MRNHFSSGDKAAYSGEEAIVFFVGSLYCNGFFSGYKTKKKHNLYLSFYFDSIVNASVSVPLIKHPYLAILRNNSESPGPDRSVPFVWLTIRGLEIPPRHYFSTKTSLLQVHPLSAGAENG